MRVAVVCGDARPALDGVADYTVRLTAELLARDTDVVIVSAGPDPSPIVEVGPPGSPRVRLPVVAAAGRWDLAGVARAAATVARLRPDVVHVQFAPSAYGYRGEAGLLPALLGRVPLVTTVHEHGWWAWAPDRVRPALARTVWPALERAGAWDREIGLLAARSAALVATNPVHAASLRVRLPRAAVRRIPIGPNLPVLPVDRAEARAGVRAALGLPRDTPLVAFFGFVHPVKGIRYLLPALARVRAAHPGAHLVVAGGFESRALPGPGAADWRAEVEKLVAELGLATAVTLTGWRPEDEVSRLLTAADAAVLPFTAGTTTRSGALLACAAHGLPLVVTAADPPDPALRDGDTALLVPVRSTAALAVALSRALGDADLAARLRGGAAGLAAAHDWGAIADAHLDLYAGAAR